MERPHPPCGRHVTTPWPARTAPIARRWAWCARREAFPRRPCRPLAHTAAN